MAEEQKAELKGQPKWSRTGTGLTSQKSQLSLDIKCDGNGMEYFH